VPPPARSAGDPAAGRGVQWTSVESCQCSVPSSSTVTGALPSNCSIVASSGDWQFGHALAITPPVRRFEVAKDRRCCLGDGGQRIGQHFRGHPDLPMCRRSRRLTRDVECECLAHLGDAVGLALALRSTDVTVEVAAPDVGELMGEDADPLGLVALRVDPNQLLLPARPTVRSAVGASRDPAPPSRRIPGRVSGSGGLASTATALGCRGSGGNCA
jgi:hypothetical protein